jgi:prepilin-type N-terminal cleavage/methylation domain-containing protein
MHTHHSQHRSGFTLIEVLLVIAILTILAGIVIAAINPAKQVGESQNAQRRSDIKAILDAVHEYSIDHSGFLPSESIPIGADCLTDGHDICTPGISCDGVNIDELITDQTYLTTLPSDPSSGTGDITGYRIFQTVHGRVGVCAPDAYGEEDIVIVR